MKQSKEEFIKSEGADFPGKTYVDCVLQHVFDFQRNYLLKDMFQVHKAHITMLTEENLMKKEEAKVILNALKKIEGMSKDQLLYTEQHEDLFFSVEHLNFQEANVIL